MDGGKPLMQCLKDRKTARQNEPDKLPLQVLSNLLWAAAGVNRPEKGLRTVSLGSQYAKMSISMLLPRTGYTSMMQKHTRLKPHLSEDIRKLVSRSGRA